MPNGWGSGLRALATKVIIESTHIRSNCKGMIKDRHWDTKEQGGRERNQRYGDRKDIIKAFS